MERRARYGNLWFLPSLGIRLDGDIAGVYSMPNSGFGDSSRSGPASQAAAIDCALSEADTPELVASIRIALGWIEELVADGAYDAQIDDVIELIRPVFMEYCRRTRPN